MIAHRNLLIILTTVVIVGAGGWNLLKTHQPPTTVTPAFTHKKDILRYPPGSPQLAEIHSDVSTVEPLPLSEPLNARLAYDESVTTRVSSPLVGRVVSMPVDIGDHVNKGQPLLILDSPDLGSALADAQKAKADLQRKENAFHRSRILYEGGVLARKSLEDADADWQQARAEYGRTQLRLANLHASYGTKGETFSLVAPISGIVTERNVNPGAEVGPASTAPLFVVSDPKRLWAMIDLPEHLIDKVRLGQMVALEAQTANNVSFPAVIERVAPTLDPATRRIPVRVSVANPEGQLRPEMFVRVRLLAGDSPKVLRVPSTAIITQGVTHFVFIERSAGEFEKRRVEVALQDRDFVYLSAGITAMEKVVQSGTLLLASELAGGE